MPVANPRRALKKWPTAAIEGVNSSEVPKPVSKLHATMNCQSSETHQHIEAQFVKKFTYQWRNS